jgi:hypothetical protein
MLRPAEIDPERKLSRRETAEALTAAGFPTAEATLASKATRGGGPSFSKFGRRVIYRWADALSWAEGRLTDPMIDTSADDDGLSKSRRSSTRHTPEHQLTRA